MNKSFNIDVSGGVAAFGVVSQGDHDHVNGHAVLTSERVDQHVREAEDAMRKLSAEYEKTGAHVANGSGLLRAARENFSWAYPAIKDFAKAAWPLLLASMGT